MTKGFNRLKLLVVLDALKRNSMIKDSYDDNRFLSARDLIGEINRFAHERYGYPEVDPDDDEYASKSCADRKSIYNYINSLEEYGYKIERNIHRGFYLEDYQRDLETAELRLIVDALVGSKFITARKTKQIIGKLEKMSCVKTGSLQNRRVVIEKMLKSDNMSVIYNIDEIERAIDESKKISFKYQRMLVDFNYSEKKIQPFIVRDAEDESKEKVYVQSPFTTIFHNDNLYMISYDSQSHTHKTFRVDRMKDVMVMDDEKAEGISYFDKLSVAEYSRTAFSMFGGENINIVLRVKRSLIDVIVDRFGKDISVYMDDDKSYCRCSVNVQKSRMFFSWLSGFGREVELIYPENLKDEYADYLSDLLAMYRSGDIQSAAGSDIRSL